MQLPEPCRKHLHDLQRAIAEIEEFSAGKTIEELNQDRALQLILEREFEMLGEAMNRLLRDCASAEQEIRDARRIVGLRNILAHGYDSIDYSILWAAIVNHLDHLKADIDRLIQA